MSFSHLILGRTYNEFWTMWGRDQVLTLMEQKANLLGELSARPFWCLQQCHFQWLEQLRVRATILFLCRRKRLFHMNHYLPLDLLVCQDQHHVQAQIQTYSLRQKHRAIIKCRIELVFWLKGDASTPWLDGVEGDAEGVTRMEYDQTRRKRIKYFDKSRFW